MLAAGFAAAGTAGYKEQRTSQVAGGTGLVSVEVSRLHCMRIARQSGEAGNGEIDLILSHTRFFLLISKEIEDQIHNKLR